MGKTKKDITSIIFNNPFLAGDRKELWKKLEAGSRPISKDEVFKKAQEKKKDDR
jgi:DNA-nicking Smr family endonuclease